MEGSIFSDKRLACRIEELTSSILEKGSVVIHRVAKDEAEQRSFYRLLQQKGRGVEALDVETGKGLVQLTLLALFAAAKILLLHLSARQEEPQPVASQMSSLSAWRRWAKSTRATPKGSATLTRPARCPTAIGCWPGWGDGSPRRSGRAG